MWSSAAWSAVASCRGGRSASRPSLRFLALTDGRRRFEQMSHPRFAGWGAMGGLLLAALLARVASLGRGDVLALAPTLAVASAVCTSGSLALARRAGEASI